MTLSRTVRSFLCVQLSNSFTHLHISHIQWLFCFANLPSLYAHAYLRYNKSYFKLFDISYILYVYQHFNDMNSFRVSFSFLGLH